MAIDPKQYAEELLKAAGVSDDTVKQAVMNVFSNETVSKRLGDDILRQQDYSRNMDALRVEQQKTTDYYKSLLDWKAVEEPKLTAVNTQLQTYEALYGPLNGQPRQQVVQQVQPDLTAFEKKWNEELGKRDQQMISLLKDGMSIASRHAVEFKEALDTEALADLAMKAGKPLKQAYEDFVAPRRQEQQAEAFKQKLADARAEGAREFASTHKIPVDSGPKEYHPIFDRDTSKMVETKDGRLTRNGERALQSGFVEEWEKSAAGTSGT